MVFIDFSFIFTFPPATSSGSFAVEMSRSSSERSLPHLDRSFTNSLDSRPHRASLNAPSPSSQPGSSATASSGYSSLRTQRNKLWRGSWEIIRSSGSLKMTDSVGSQDDEVRSCEKFAFVFKLAWWCDNLDEVMLPVWCWNSTFRMCGCCEGENNFSKLRFVLTMYSISSFLVSEVFTIVLFPPKESSLCMNTHGAVTTERMKLVSVSRSFLERQPPDSWLLEFSPPFTDQWCEG